MLTRQVAHLVALSFEIGALSESRVRNMRKKIWKLFDVQNRRPAWEPNLARWHRYFIQLDNQGYSHVLYLRRTLSCEEISIELTYEFPSTRNTY
jgi:hypothetical protein